MHLRGKDFCNCEHAQLLRLALEKALFELAFPSGRILATIIIREALDAHRKAERDHASTYASGDSESEIV